MEEVKEDTVRKIELEILHWLISYPLMSEYQLAVGLGLDAGSLRGYLRELTDELGFLDRLPCADPALRKGVQAYLPTDGGIRALAQAEGLSSVQCVRRRRLTKGRVYRIINSLSYYYGLRTFMVRLGQAARRHGQMVALFEEEPLFRFTRSRREGRFRPDAFSVYRAGDAAYPFILLWDVGYGRVSHFRGVVDSLYDLREADRYPFPAEYRRFPAVCVVTTDLWRLLEWQRMFRLSGIRRRSAEVQLYLALRRDLRPGPEGKGWNFFRPVWFDGSGQRVPFLSGAPSFPWEEYRTFLERRFFAVEAPRRSGRRILGDPLLERAQALRSLFVSAGEEEMALVNLALRRREKEVLLWIGDHPLLSVRLLALFMGNRESTIRRDIPRLVKLGLIERAEPPDGFQGEAMYLLTDRGVRWLVKRRRARHRTFLLGHWQRTVRWMLTCFRHTRALYECMATFAAPGLTGGPPGSCGLHLWESEFRKNRRYEYRGFNRVFAPDAYGVFRLGDRGFRFFLEVDMDTVHGRSLERKAESYYIFRRSREFVEHGFAFPSVLVVTTTLGRGRGILSTFQRVAGWLGVGVLPLYVTTQQLMAAEGPLAPIWLTPTSKNLVRWLPIENLPVESEKEATREPHR